MWPYKKKVLCVGEKDVTNNVAVYISIFFCHCYLHIICMCFLYVCMFKKRNKKESLPQSNDD